MYLIIQITGIYWQWFNSDLHVYTDIDEIALFKNEHLILKINQKLNWKLVYKEQRSSTACTTWCVLHYACLIIIHIICVLTIRHRLVVCTTLGLPNYYIIGIFTIKHHLVALHYGCLIIIYILCIFTIKHRPRWC